MHFLAAGRKSARNFLQGRRLADRLPPAMVMRVGSYTNTVGPAYFMRGSPLADQCRPVLQA